jgi:hypothetical protein
MNSYFIKVITDRGLDTEAATAMFAVVADTAPDALRLVRAALAEKSWIAVNEATRVSPDTARALDLSVGEVRHL